MISELKESIPHGTREYPYDQCHIHHPKHQPFQIPVHWHDTLEIIYVRCGLLKVSIEDQSYLGHSGAVFLVNPRELHFMGSDDPAIDYYTLLFPLEFISFQSMDGLEATLMMLRSGQLLLNHEIPDGSLSKKLPEILEQLIKLNQESPSLHRQIGTRILLLQCLDLLISHDLLHAPSSADNRLNMARELLAYLNEHYIEKITLSDLAGQFHLSEKYISRQFSRHFQITFTGYINHLRLSCAQNLLETTELPITEIALRSGFPNVSYFIRMFKGSYGVSPLKYRKSIPSKEQPADLEV